MIIKNLLFSSVIHVEEHKLVQAIEYREFLFVCTLLTVETKEQVSFKRPPLYYFIVSQYPFDHPFLFIFHVFVIVAAYQSQSEFIICVSYL